MRYWAGYFLIFCVTLLVVGIGGVWSLNTLFGLGLAYSIKNFLAFIFFFLLGDLMTNQVGGRR